MTELYSNRSPVNLDLQLSATPWVAGGGGRMRDASLSADVPTEGAYDGIRVIQVRDGNNAPLVSYTRGRDLSGSLEGAGGIGGLLARSHGYSSGNWSTHNFYHADGGGNVAYLVNSSQTLAASYKYDAYGNTVSQSGGLASANVYRFSSKELHAASGLYYYGYRWCAPNLQRWLNRDPIGGFGFKLLHQTPQNLELDEPNLYVFLSNGPIGRVDPLGLSWSSTGEAIWTALGYIVPGGEIPAAAMAAADCAKIAIIARFKRACEKCYADPPDDDEDCKICNDHEKVKEKLQPKGK